MILPTRSRRGARVSRFISRAFARPTTMTMALLALASSGAIAVTGCRTTNLAAGPALGVAGYTYLYGTGSQGFPYPIADVKRAVFQAMADLRMRGLEESRDVGSVTNISAIAADRRMANISIVSQPTFSLVSARFGSLGDRPQTRAFFDLVSRYLTSPAGSLSPNGIEPPESSATDLPDPNASATPPAPTTGPTPIPAPANADSTLDEVDNLPAFPTDPAPSPAPAPARRNGNGNGGANGVKSSFEGESPQPPDVKGVSDEVMLRDVSSAGYRDSPIP